MRWDERLAGLFDDLEQQAEGLAIELGGLERLEPGDIVLPGSVARAVPIAAGQAAYATFDRLGEVSVRLV